MLNNDLVDLQEEILRVFEHVTRYPRSVIDPNASLEDDLGVDSVKLGEVFSVLREKYSLPSQLEIPREQLTTIQGISESLSGFLSRASGATNGALRSAAPAQPAVEAPAARVDTSDLREQILHVFEQVTRYPRAVIDPAASLEEDLGIDSVKLGEVFSVMREKYDLPTQLDISRESLATINGIVDALNGILAKRATPRSPAPVPKAVPMVARSNGAGHASERSAAPSTAAPRAVSATPFTGKVAFISGSGRGLGKDIAAHLAELGATVIVNSFHSRARGEETTQEIERAGGKAIHLWGSMANPAHVHSMFDQIEARFGALDFFISNASNGMLASIDQLTAEHWEKAFRTNVIGLHQGAVRAARMMRRNGGGKIITLSSPGAHGYVDYFGCMGAVKAAVESLTKTLAIEYAPDNIQVNCVSPGPIDAELLRKWPESDRLIQVWKESTPYKRLTEARDVSQFIAYLLSDAAAIFTGSVLILDGGISSRGW